MPSTPVANYSAQGWYFSINGVEDLDFFGPWEMIAIWSQKFGGPNELILVNESHDHVTSAKGLNIKTNRDAC